MPIAMLCASCAARFTPRADAALHNAMSINAASSSLIDAGVMDAMCADGLGFADATLPPAVVVTLT
jgi:hypothetical protein